MSPVEDHAQLASDAELITRVRAGDRTAFGDLYSRHASAASALARQFARSSAEADDLVSEAFARVLDGMLEGKGPDTAFRAYLFTTLRNTAYDRTRKDKRLQFTDDMETHDVAVQGDDPVIADLETGLIGKAFAGLPERWQTVLWHTQVEGQSAAEVGVLLGMAPNAVSSLAFRAREGLREAYLQAHLAETAAERCRTTVDRLGAWTRGGLSKREKAQVDAHLEECDRCPALAAELSEINTGLRGLLAPLLLGGAAVGYISTLGPVTPLAQLGVLAGGHAAAGTGGAAAAHGGSHLAVGLAKIGSWGPRAAVAGVAAAAVVIAGIAIALTAGRSSGPNTASDGSSVASTAGGAGTGANGVNGSGANGNGNGAGGNGAGGNGAATAGGSSGSTGGTTAAGGASVPGGGGSSTPTAILTPPTVPTGAAGTPSIPTVAPIVAPVVVPVVVPPVPGRTGSPSSIPTPSSTSTQGSATPSQGSATPSQSPATPSTSSAPTSTSPTTGTSTTANVPPPPAALGLDPTASVVSADLSAGGVGSLTVKLANSGGTASAGGQAVAVTVPDGFNLGQPTLTPALRGSFSAFAVTSAGCTPLGKNSMSCSLPAIAPGSTLTLAFELRTNPTAKSGFVSVSFNSGRPALISAVVRSGYSSVTLTSPHDLGQAATSVATLTAVPRSGVTDLGTISVPVAIAANMRIVGLAPATGATTAAASCAVDGDQFVCESGAITSGVDIAVAVAKSGTPGSVSTAAATDQGGRNLPTGALTISSDANGGYLPTNPVTVTPVGPLARGTTGSVHLVGHPTDGTIDPGPITLPIVLADGVKIDVLRLPIGCVAAGSTVVCTPAENGGSADFTLPVKVDADAGGGAIFPVMLPTDESVRPVAADGSPVNIAPATSGYASITGQLNGLDAGSTTTLTLVGTPTAGVLDAGDITLSTTLADGVTIVGGDCTINAGTASCQSKTDGTRTTWILDVQVAAGAPQFTLGSLPVVTLPSGSTIAPVSKPGTDLTIRAAATGSCATPAALDNGDFETPIVPDGAGHDVTNSDGTVWQTTATDNQLEYWRNGSNSTGANNNVQITAQSGSQWVELNANQQSALYQDVDTVPGQIMHWTIWHRARDVGAAAGHDNDVMQVQIGVPDAIGTVTHPGADTDVTVISDGPAAWVKHTGNYTVPAGQTVTRFQFAAVSTASGNDTVGNFLDNISFNTVPCLTSTSTVSNVTAGGTGTTAAQGDTLKYTTTIQNLGGDTATAINLADLIPAGTTLVGPSPSVPSSLDPGDPAATVSFEVTVNADLPSGTKINHNAVVSYQWDSAAALKSISNTVTTTVK